MKTCIYCGSKINNGKAQCGTVDTPTAGCLLISQLREEIQNLTQSVYRMQYSLNLVGEPYALGGTSDTDDTSYHSINNSSSDYIKL